MGAICGILGRAEPSVVRLMSAALAHRAPSMSFANGDDFCVASSGAVETPLCGFEGHPQLPDGVAVGSASLPEYCRSLRDPGALRLTGAFAGFLRRKQGEFWLMRDRLGRRPLYYAPIDGALLFASEPKALLASGCVKRSVNRRSVDLYFTFGCVPSPGTLLAGVYRVQPGHVLTFAKGKIVEHRFASFDTTPLDIDKEEAAEQLRDILERVVQAHSDEHVLLSSGIDSAALTALRPNAQPIFVSLERGWQDEGRLARESAKQMGVPLTVVTGRRFTVEEFAATCRAMDDPVADASVFPMALMLQRASTCSPTLVSGHGADGLLGGFPRYRFLQKTRRAGAAVPANLLSDILPTLPPNAFVRRGSYFLTSRGDSLEAYLSLLSFFEPDERQQLYSDSMRDASREQCDISASVRAYFAGLDLTQGMLKFDLSVAFPDMLLMKCERLAAAHGVELDLPYFDDELVDFAVRIPSNIKFGVRSKPLLRMAMKGVLPHRVRLRARRGFHVPQSGRLQQVIESITRTTITQDRAYDIGLFQWTFIEQVLRSASHNIYRRRQFWALLLFFAWYRYIVEEG